MALAAAAEEETLSFHWDCCVHPPAVLFNPHLKIFFQLLFRASGKEGGGEREGGRKKH